MGVREKEKKKTYKHETLNGPNPSPTPTHLNCSSCRVGQSPSRRPGAPRPQPRTPLLPPPGLNLWLRGALCENHAPRVASFKSGLVTSRSTRTNTPREPHPITNRLCRWASVSAAGLPALRWRQRQRQRSVPGAMRAMRSASTSGETWDDVTSACSTVHDADLVL